MNISATLSVFKLLINPSLCLPHSIIPTFNQLPIPLSQAFAHRDGEKGPDIRAVVLDKDDCFAIPHENVVYKDYEAKFRELRNAYPGAKLLIVSNSSGTRDDPDGKEASILERATGVAVLRHSTKKPGCSSQILSHFLSSPSAGVTDASQIAIVGDRLVTDVLMANGMGSWSVWVRQGVVKEKGLFTRMEGKLFEFLTRKGYTPPRPRSIFEE